MPAAALPNIVDIARTAATDLELLSIEDWRLKWAPNLKFQLKEELAT